jgi:hypothetical protein
VINCPKCGSDFQVTMKESLDPYSMSMRVSPGENRMVSAETAARMIFALSRALKAAGKITDHKTEVYLTEASVDDDMTINLTLSAVTFCEEPS